MEIAKYGAWEIAVDIEKTRDYYSRYQVKDTQIQRNFIEYCQTLSSEERNFFDSLGIDPTCCEVESILGASSRGELDCLGFYYVCGEYLKFPPFTAITIEELAANNFVDPIPDPSVTVGNFKFEFAHPERPYPNIPDDLPEGYICVHFICEKTKWLLNEPCEKIMNPFSERIIYGEVSPEEIEELGKEMMANGRIELLSEWLERNSKLFSNLNISAEPMSDEEYLAYKEKWVEHFAPADADMDRVRELCVTHEKYSTYLWHLFSFEIAHAMSGDAAVEKFSSIPRRECILVSHWDDLCYRISDGSNLTPQVLENFDDVTLTAADFSWTYSQTHESELGPYYYEKV